MVIHRHVLEEMDRRVIIPVAVHPAACEIGGIVDSRHGDAAVEQIRPAERHNTGVCCAETAADCHGKPVCCVPLYEYGIDLVHDVVIVLFLNVPPVGFVAAKVRPALFVYSVYCKYLNLSALYKTGYSVDHPDIFKVFARGILSRENQERKPLVSVDQEVHFPVEEAAPVREVFSFHFIFSYSGYCHLVRKVLRFPFSSVAAGKSELLRYMLWQTPQPARSLALTVCCKKASTTL